MSVSWVMSQDWERLLFMHWAVEPDVMAAHLPAPFEPDLYDGRAWIGVVPFAMRRIRARFLPPIPGTSAFLELNVRTYVEVDGRPGVYFFSLEANHRLAVRVARRFFHLPYMDAAMALDEDGPTVRYRSRRTHEGERAADFDASYRPTGPVALARPGSLDSFLTDRFSLFTLDGRGRVMRGDIAHPPWPLQPATVEIAANSMSSVPLPDDPPLLHYAHHIRTRIRRLRPAR